MSKQKWPNKLIIIRHGQSERNVAKDIAKAQGGRVSYVDSIRDQDTPLTQLGQGQALAVGTALSKQAKYDVMLVSPYLRTRQTAALIKQGLGYEIEEVVEERIREIEFGLLDGLTPEGIRVKYPEEVERRKKEGKYWYRPPGGESRPDVALRVHSVLGTISREYAERRVLIVCHSVVVLVFRRLLERWGEQEYMKVDKENDVKNCSMTSYAWNYDTSKLELKAYNEIPNLLDARGEAVEVTSEQAAQNQGLASL